MATETLLPTALRQLCPRFQLRTLLALVTVVAAGSWAHWIVMPWMQARYEQIQFEEGVHHLRLCELNAVFGYAPAQPDEYMMVSVGPEMRYQIGMYTLQNADYCMVFACRKQAEFKNAWICTGLSVYRLEHAPSDYKPDCEYDVNAMNAPSLIRRREMSWIDDFAAFILGDATGWSRFHYELIHSDPPVDAAVK
jgi:hypothetical protein